MKLITIHLAAGVAPFQLEGFAPSAERSIEGALHFHGNATKAITTDELAALKAARPDLVAKLLVVPVCAPVARKSAPVLVPVLPADAAGGHTLGGEAAKDTADAKKRDGGAKKKL